MVKRRLINMDIQQKENTHTTIKIFVEQVTYMKIV